MQALSVLWAGGRRWMAAKPLWLRHGRSARQLEEGILGKTLVIVESPAKARTIAGILGRDYSVRASMGHVRDLPRKAMGVDVENGFRPQYVTAPRKKKTIQKLKDAARNVETL